MARAAGWRSGGGSPRRSWSWWARSRLLRWGRGWRRSGRTRWRWRRPSRDPYQARVDVACFRRPPLPSAEELAQSSAVAVSWGHFVVRSSVGTPGSEGVASELTFGGDDHGGRGDDDHAAEDEQACGGRLGDHVVGELVDCGIEAGMKDRHHEHAVAGCGCRTRRTGRGRRTGRRTRWRR